MLLKIHRFCSLFFKNIEICLNKCDAFRSAQVWFSSNKTVLYSTIRWTEFTENQYMLHCIVAVSICSPEVPLSTAMRPRVLSSVYFIFDIRFYVIQIGILTRFIKLAFSRDVSLASILNSWATTFIHRGHRLQQIWPIFNLLPFNSSHYVGKLPMRHWTAPSGPLNSI